MLRFGEKLDEREYTFPCKVVTKDTWYEDHDGKKQSTTHIVFLPEECSQTYFFYEAWLPSHPDQDYEVVAVVLSPINKLGRFSVNMKNKFYNENHLILMTMDQGNIRENVLEALKQRQGELTVNISVQPASSEETKEV